MIKDLLGFWILNFSCAFSQEPENVFYCLVEFIRERVQACINT